jgi:tetratricopeptide (TPR) repeat protein
LSTYEAKSVAATFTAQLDDLEHQSPDASNLLKALSFFDPESIPLDMITQGAESLSLSLFPSPVMLSDTPPPGKVLSLLRQTKQDCLVSPHLKTLLPFILSPIRLQDAITQLQNRSLVKYLRSADTSVLRIHDLIRIMVQASLTNSSADQGWFEIAVELACRAFQYVEDPESYKCWSRCAILAPHFHMLTMRDESDDAYGNRSLSIMKANVGIARYLLSSGGYGEAETLLGRALEASKSQLGIEHPDTLMIMHHLARAHDFQGRYNEAETQYKRVLALREQQLGLDHPDTLQTMHYLAGLYIDQGRYDEAETKCKRVLALREKQLGLEHPDTLRTMHNLALVYHSKGRYDEAEIQYKHVLALAQKQLGLEHPNVLRTMHNLALVYESQGRYDEAEIEFKHTLALTEKQLGLEHPHTLQTMHGLAYFCHSRGRHSEAETQYKYVLGLAEKQLRVEHPDTLSIMRNLARLHESLAHHSEAKALRERILAIEERKRA